MEEGMKKCSRCQEWKGLGEFSRNARKKDGYHYYCKPCKSASSRESYLRIHGRRRREVPEGMKYCPRCDKDLPLDGFGKNRTKGDGLQSYCKPCMQVHSSESFKNNPETALRLRLSRYGVTPDEYRSMLEDQDYRCAICRTDTPDARNWHVEHCHDSGEVRGITCHSCNSAISRFGEDTQTLGAAIEYLERPFLVIPDLPVPHGNLTLRDGYLHHRYRIRVVHYDWLLEQQNYGCAICGEKCSSGKNLAVDHSHDCCPGNRSCGKCLRGLLCQAHNHALGLFKDSPEIMRSAIAYLEKYSTKKDNHALAT